MVFLVVLLVLMPSLVSAQRTVSADKPIAVKLDVGQPTSVAFPERIEKVQTVQFGGTSETTPGAVTAAQRPLSVEWYGPYCYLILNDETYAGRMFVLGASGKQYLITFKAGTPGDVMVHVVPPKASAPVAAPVPVGVPAILRALWTQQPLPGQQVAEVSPPALPDARLVLVDSQAIQVAGHLGLVLRVRNASPGLLALDVRTEGEAVPEGTLALAAWVWPPRLTVQAIAVAQEVLESGQETRILVVLERRG